MSYEPDNYRPRQDRHDARYRSDYAAWLATKTPEELWRLKQLGLDQPAHDDHGHGANFADRDLAETSLASEESHLLDHIEPACDQPGYQAQHTDVDAEKVWDIIRRLVGDLLAADNARLALECVALVSGVSFLGDSMRAIARKHAMSRAAVSKRCVEFAQQIGLPPSRAMRPLTARIAYVAARKRSLRSRAH